MNKIIEKYLKKINNECTSSSSGIGFAIDNIKVINKNNKNNKNKREQNNK